MDALYDGRHRGDLLVWGSSLILPKCIDVRRETPASFRSAPPAVLGHVCGRVDTGGRKLAVVPAVFPVSPHRGVCLHLRRRLEPLAGSGLLELSALLCGASDPAFWASVPGDDPMAVWFPVPESAGHADSRGPALFHSSDVLCHLRLFRFVCGLQLAGSLAPTACFALALVQPDVDCAGRVVTRMRLQVPDHWHRSTCQL